jgi:hypothetical protein
MRVSRSVKVKRLFHKCDTAKPASHRRKRFPRLDILKWMTQAGKR